MGSLLADFAERHAGIEFVHLQWVDFAGIIRERVLPKPNALKLESLDEGFRAGAFATLGLMGAISLPRDFFIGVPSTLYPDWSSIGLLSSSSASVNCNVSEESDFEPDCNYRKPFRQCPRTALRKVVSKAQEEYGLSFLVGFELEFYLLDETTQRESLGQVSGASWNCWSAALSTQGPRWACLQDCVKALAAADIEVLQVHAECGPSQYEIATSPAPPIQAIDRLVRSQCIIRAEAIKHGYKAVFAPKPLSAASPSGLHAHLSWTRKLVLGRNGDTNDDEDGWSNQAFLGGILNLLPALVAVGMSTEMSYTRVQPDCAGEWIAWGTNNRDCPIRKISETHYELRAIDALANMYWVIATYIASGLLGIQEKMQPVEHDCRDFPARLDNIERDKFRIIRKMPISLAEALKEYKRTAQAWNGILDQDIVEFYALSKEGEALELAKMPQLERHKFYLEHC